MASQIQMVIYEGFLAADPEMRYTPKGVAVTNFRMGSNRTYKNSEGVLITEPTWLKVTAWGTRGDPVNKYCEKGSHVIVFGTLRPGKNGSPEIYKKNNEEYAASYEITADRVRILKGKDGTTPPVENGNDDDLPF